MARLGVEAALLRMAVILAGFVPVGARIARLLKGASLPRPGAGPALDSHVRYLSGLLLAIGVAFWTTVPSIERQGARFRLLTLLVVTGGAARLLGIVLHGWPPASMLFGLMMELVVTPLLCLWQTRINGRRQDGSRWSFDRSA